MFVKSSIKNTKAEGCDATGVAILCGSGAHKKILLSICILYCTISTAAQHNLAIVFKHVAGNKPLNTDSTYINQSGEIFKVRHFKYYVSNIVLYDSIENETQQLNGYFLIDERIDTSKTILFTTSLQQVTSIEFLLGVDSLKNVNGIQTGVLDPARGMFWTWNTGYVMAKLEGTAPVANTPAHTFSYHIGGYKRNENAARKIVLSIPEDINDKKQIFITADVLRWFSAVHQMKIAEVAFCHEPGERAMQFADNYAAMFNAVTVK